MPIQVLGRRDELCVTREAVRDEFSKTHGDQREQLSNVKNNATGSVKVVKFEKTDSTRNRSDMHANGVAFASRSNKF